LRKFSISRQPCQNQRNRGDCHEQHSGSATSGIATSSIAT
jgi:hypothetical protein